MQSFTINGVTWRVVRVSPDSPALIDRTGKRTVATTDDKSRLMCVSSAVSGAFLSRVLAHEAAHAAMVSYGLDRELADVMRSGDGIAAEEWCCNLVADFAPTVLAVAARLARGK